MTSARTLALPIIGLGAALMLAACGSTPIQGPGTLTLRDGTRLSTGIPTALASDEPGGEPLELPRNVLGSSTNPTNIINAGGAGR